MAFLRLNRLISFLFPVYLNIISTNASVYSNGMIYEFSYYDLRIALVTSPLEIEAA